ncbi:MFS transporter [Streptomyces celluloflavus]|uniref:MFS transporter n=1 Tax=Streptomyces celluloflavus TaxID=58344 RepID=UPI00364BA9AC
MPAIHGGASSPTLRTKVQKLSPGNQRLVLYATLAAVFLGTLDSTLVVTALPRMGTDLNGDESAYTWVVTGYLLSSTVTGPLYGRYSDLYGRKPLLLAGLGLFLIGSGLCSTAGTFTELILYRVLQGAGAGALFPLGMVLIRETVEWQAMARLQSFMGGMLAVTLIGGPYLGGVLTDTLGWRSLFWTNLVLGAPIALAIALLLPAHRDGREQGRPDVWGMLLLASGVSVLLVGLTEAGNGGADAGALSSPGAVTTCVVAGVVALGVFVKVEQRTAVPVLPLRLFRGRDFPSLLSAGFFFSAASLPCSVFLPLYFHDVRGFSPSTAGLMLSPLLLAMVLSNRAAANLIWVERTARLLLPAGAVLLTLGCAVFFGLGTDTPLWLIIAIMTVIGLGLGPSMAPIGLMVQSSVPPQDMGTASSSIVLLKQLGQSVGLAVGQTLLSSRLLAASSGTSAEDTANAVGLTMAVVGVACGAGALVSSLLVGKIELRVPGGPPAPAKSDEEQNSSA